MTTDLVEVRGMSLFIHIQLQISYILFVSSCPPLFKNSPGIPSMSTLLLFFSFVTAYSTSLNSMSGSSDVSGGVMFFNSWSTCLSYWALSVYSFSQYLAHRSVTCCLSDITCICLYSILLKEATTHYSTGLFVSYRIVNRILHSLNYSHNYRWNVQNATTLNFNTDNSKTQQTSKTTKEVAAIV